MIAVLQRVRRASVEIGGELFSAIGHGLLVLVCVVEGDTEAEAALLTRKIANLRIFDDEKGVMNRSVTDAGGEILAVSQFTLAANARKGNRPSYIRAAGHDLAVPLYDRFCNLLSELTGRETRRGQFGADMQVSLVNDGPVTIILNTDTLK